MYHVHILLKNVPENKTEKPRKLEIAIFQKNKTKNDKYLQRLSG